MTLTGQWTTVMALVLGATACASGGAGGSPTTNAAQAPPATIFSGPEAPTMYADAPRAVARTYAVPVAAVRTAVQQVFVDYSIPVTMSNPATGQIGNADFYRSGRFMGRPMVELVSCGSGITGPNAATYRIFMSLTATVKATAQGGASVGITFIATARDMAGGTSSDRLPCGSSGRVEQLLLDRITTLVAK